MSIVTSNMKFMADTGFIEECTTYNYNLLWMAFQDYYYY